eukprot:GHRQ01034729.1.p1 GENE.GHRQ01034729.1~~GHRQ01034729.1.p1  ORF type:complete len:100 (-),score=20.92 GHRQ01034729.1:337-636(-)
MMMPAPVAALTTPLYKLATSVRPRCRFDDMLLLAAFAELALLAAAAAAGWELFPARRSDAYQQYGTERTGLVSRLTTSTLDQVDQRQSRGKAGRSSRRG